MHSTETLDHWLTDDDGDGVPDDVDQDPLDPEVGTDSGGMSYLWIIVILIVVVVIGLTMILGKSKPPNENME